MVGWAGSQSEDHGETSVTSALASGASGGWHQAVRNGFAWGEITYNIIVPIIVPLAGKGTEDQRW